MKPCVSVDMKVRPYRPDLHAHTTASDGILSPRQLVQEASQMGVSLLAVTDHDTMKGLPEALSAADEEVIGLIPGIELSTAGEEEVHLLAYFVHPEMKRLSRLLDEISLDRQTRCLKFLERFRSLGVDLHMDDLHIPEGTDCNRPHIGRALVRKGYVSSLSEAFQRYLAVGKPGYIQRIKLESTDVIRLLREEGAVPVLAHPELIRSTALKLPERISILKEAGLQGIEAYHSKHSRSACVYWDGLAREKGLLVTGGSDFHQQGDDHGLLGSAIRWWNTADKDADRLMKLKPVIT